VAPFGTLAEIQLHFAIIVVKVTFYKNRDESEAKQECMG
jgi:hypothetical protein